MSLDGAYFDRLYAASDDPWGFSTRWYEHRKYALTLAALPAPHYDSALEIGCSVGVLTALLAGRCTALLALDPSVRALAQARTRVPGNVTLLPFARATALLRGRLQTTVVAPLVSV